MSIIPDIAIVFGPIMKVHCFTGVAQVLGYFTYSPVIRIDTRTSLKMVLFGGAYQSS